MGGMHPPHQPKSNDFGQKISLYFEKLVSISGCIPPTSVKLTVPDEKSLSISVKTFFFFFGDHLILGGKNVRISDFGTKITLNCGEDIRIFEGLCLKSPPPKFSRSATEHSTVLLTETPKRVRIHPTCSSAAAFRDKRINMESINRYIMSLVGPLAAAGPEIKKGTYLLFFF